MNCVGFVMLTLLLAVKISYAQAPLIIQQPVNTTVTLGQTATFSIQAASAVQYQWYRDYMQVAGATSASYSFVPMASDTNHLYTAVVWSADHEYVQSAVVSLHVTPRTDIPTVTDVETFGSNSAGKAADSFGMVVDSYVDWEFAAVAAMGGKWVRTDGCQWESLELQNIANNSSGGFSLSNAPNCVSELASAKRYGLSVDNVAYWAPPHSQVATAVVAADVPAGSMAVPLTITTGTLAGYPARDLLVFGSSAFNSRIDGGAPVDALTGTTLQLPEPTVASLSAGTALTLQALLYPPVLIEPSSNPTAYLANSSVQAWLGYVYSLQNILYSQGVTGVLELWNEPENGGELWDHAPSFYTTPPDHFELNGTGRYLALAASVLPEVPGVKVLNGWSNTSGWGGIYFGPYTQSLPLSPSIVNSKFAGDAVHPYGINPEEGAWLPAAVAQQAAVASENWLLETPIGGQFGSNLKSLPYYDLQPSAAGGIPVAITETGIQIDQAPGETEVMRTRFNVRQFLTYSGLHVSPIIFFKAGQASNFEWFEEDAAHTPHPIVTAFTSLITDLRSIGNPPLTTPSSASLPQVSSYTGFYPLATTSFTGFRNGDQTNSVLFYSWQKTYTVPPGGGSTGDNYSTNNPAGIPPMPLWVTLPSPASVPLTVTVPTGYAVSSVKNVVTQEVVSYTLFGNQLTYLVADDPIQVLLTPLATALMSFSVEPQTLGAGPFPVSASSNSPAPISYSVLSGLATVNNNIVTPTGIGQVKLQASQQSSNRYTAATATASFAVGPQVQAISFASVPAQFFGGSTSLTATATSGLPVAFSSTTGRVCIVRANVVRFIGVGSCTIQVVQPGNATVAAAPPVYQNIAVQAVLQH